MINKNITASTIEIENQEYMTKVFGWMFAGLLSTAIVSYYVSMTITRINPILFFMAVLLEFFLVYRIARYVMSMSVNMATGTFIFYSALNGFTLSGLFHIYTAESLTSTFLVTASIFGFMAFYGYTTKRDLTKMGSFLMMGLIGIIIASIVNIFMKSSMMYFVISILGVLIFVGLTAYDTQKIKNMYAASDTGELMGKKAVMGALTLYLDFINLFIMLLRLFGQRR